WELFCHLDQVAERNGKGASKHVAEAASRFDGMFEWNKRLIGGTSADNSAFAEDGSFEISLPGVDQAISARWLLDFGIFKACFYVAMYFGGQHDLCRSSLDAWLLALRTLRSLDEAFGTSAKDLFMDYVRFYGISPFASNTLWMREDPL